MDIFLQTMVCIDGLGDLLMIGDSITIKRVHGWWIKISLPMGPKNRLERNIVEF